MALADFLQALLKQPGGPQAALAQAASDQGSAGPNGSAAYQNALQAAFQAQGAPQAAPQSVSPMTTGSVAPPPQTAPQASPAPSGGNSGGPSLLAGLQSLFNPQAAARNQTANWLQRQGMDAGTATLLAGNKPLLNQYLVGRMQGNKPDFQLQSIYDDKGREQKVLIDKNTGQYQAIGGAKSDNTASFGPIGQDEYGNTTYGWRDPNTQKVTPANGPSIDGSSASTAYSNSATAMLHGDDFLKTIPPALADQVKAYASGKMPLPTGYALKSPYFQKMMQMVTQYDPSFDAVNYNARAKTRADFTSGKSAQSINALNTVIGHLESLSTAADNLNNSSFPVWNKVANAYENATGDPRIKTFDTTKKAVVDELTRVWRGSGGSEGDIKTWSDQINSANSPDQLHSVIGQIGDLLESKINSLAETYKQGMGTTADPIEFVTKKSQAALDKMRGAPSDNGSGDNSSAPDLSKMPAPKGISPDVWAEVPNEKRKLWMQ